MTDENRRNDEADTDEILGSQENRPVDGAHSDKHDFQSLSHREDYTVTLTMLRGQVS